MLDAARDLGFGPLGELEFVEDVTGDAIVVVGREQAAQRSRVVARCIEVLLARLYAERGRERSKAQIEGQQLHFDAALMLLVGEGLPNAVTRRIERIGEPELVVLVVGVAVPEAHGIETARHAAGIRPCW